MEEREKETHHENGMSCESLFLMSNLARNRTMKHTMNKKERLTFGRDFPFLPSLLSSCLNRSQVQV